VGRLQSNKGMRSGGSRIRMTELRKYLLIIMELAVGNTAFVHIVNMYVTVFNFVF
jgi:hypothetical protein